MLMRQWYLKPTILQKTDKELRGTLFHEIGHKIFGWHDVSCYAAQAAMGYATKEKIIDVINSNSILFARLIDDSRFKHFFKNGDIIKSKENDFYKEYKKFGLEEIKKEEADLENKIEINKRIQDKKDESK